MNRLTSTLLLIAIIGGFIAAGVLVLFFHAPDRAIGAVLLACGMAAFLFSHALASAQQASPLRKAIPAWVSNPRPVTFMLWGAGLAILGLVQLIGL